MDRREFIKFLKSMELKDIPDEPKGDADYKELVDKGIVEAFKDLTNDEKHYAASVIKLYPAIYYNQLARRVYRVDISKRIENYTGGIKKINWEYHKYFFHQYVGPFFHIEGKFKYLKMDINDGKLDEQFINHPSSHFDFFNSFNLDDSIDYGFYPRGRVIFNNFTNEFYIYVDNLLFNKKELIEEIKRIYNLTGSNNIVLKDDHYIHSGHMVNEMSKLDEFVVLIKDSLIKSKYKAERIGNNRFYFGNDYFDALKAIYEKRVHDTTKIKEFNDVPYHSGVKKICSVSSSARLCFSWLYKKGAFFEVSLTNATDKGNDAQLDAYTEEDNTYYECKCQEVIDGEHQMLKLSYKEILEDENEFDVRNISVNEYEKTLSFNLRDMGANLDEDYDKTHFNLKQLFTHLSAMSRLPKNKQVTLKYIIFRPSKKILDKNIKIKQIYELLDREMLEIYNSRSIQNFLNKHKNIKLDLNPDNVYVYVDDPEMMVGIEE